MKTDFKLYGIYDTDKNELVTGITNPTHKYWTSYKRAKSAMDLYTKKYNQYLETQRDPWRYKNNVYYTYNPKDLIVVEIDCHVKLN